eukprot:961019-Amphidinium_carterae.1
MGGVDFGAYTVRMNSRPMCVMQSQGHQPAPGIRWAPRSGLQLRNRLQAHYEALNHDGMLAQVCVFQMAAHGIAAGP